MPAGEQLKRAKAELRDAQAMLAHRLEAAEALAAAQQQIVAVGQRMKELAAQQLDPKNQKWSE